MPPSWRAIQPIDANTAEPGAVVVLPRRVAAGAGRAGAGLRPSCPRPGRSATPCRAGHQAANVPPETGGSTAAGAAGGGVTATTLPASSQPKQHVVAAGETAWSIARKYDVSVNDLAQWNGLSSAMTLRVGQRLLIPVAGRNPGQCRGDGARRRQPDPAPAIIGSRCRRKRPPRQRRR